MFLFPIGGQEMSSFKLGRRTDKHRSLFIFCFDNLKVHFLLTFEIDISISFELIRFVF